MSKAALWVSVTVVTMLTSASVFAVDLQDEVAKDEARLIEIFKEIHQNPELGFMEVETARRIADEFRDQGYEVYEGIGKTGVVGMMKNGDGPVILLRGDMDALPIKEETDLSYKSTAIKKDKDGNEHPVMHACGHDSHVAWLIGIAKQMANLKDQWRGTLVLVAQPAEEIIMGAQAMVDDGLYDVVPKPNIVISAHNLPTYPAGTVGIASGRRMAGTDQIDVLIKGVGGHGSTPHAAKDPIVMGAMTVLGYQTIVSRLVDQYHPAVLTVGAFQSGTSNNIIPDSALLRVNLRWYRENEREEMIHSIKSVTDNTARMYDMEKDRMPQYTFKSSSTPVINQEEDYQRAKDAMALVLGPDKVLEGIPPLMGSEDFQMLASPFDDVPILFIEVGSGTEDSYKNLIEKGKMPRKMNHNPGYKVELGAIKTGVVALTGVLLEYLDSNNQT